MSRAAERDEQQALLGGVAQTDAPAEEHLSGRDWAWRRRIRSNPHSHLVYRIVIGVLGTLVILAGIPLIPLPGPGWLVVFLGVGLWSTEFHWARRLLRWGGRVLRAWTDWVRGQHLLVQGGIALVSFLFFLFVMYVTLRVGGVPTVLPDSVQRPLEVIVGQ